MIHQREEKIQRWLSEWVGLVCRFAWLVILLAALFTAGAAYFTTKNLRIDANIDNMLSGELPFRKTEVEIGRAFPQWNNLMSVVVKAENDEMADRAARQLTTRLSANKERFRSVFYPEGLPFFEKNGLLYLSVPELEKLSDDLAEAQPLLASLSADPTLRGLADILALAIGQADPETAGKSVGPVLGKMAATVRQLEEGRDAELSWQSLLADEPIDGSATTRKFILVQPILDNETLEPVSPAITAIEQAARDLGLTEENGVEVRFTGDSVMLQEELETVRTGMNIVGAVSLTLVIVLLVIGLRSFRLVGAALVTLLVGLVWTAAFAIAAFEALNIISVAFAVLFIGLSVDFGIHFTLRYREAIGHAEKRQALRDAGAGVGLALLLSAVAAAIGFLSFLPTDYRGVSELGVISGVGMFIALFLNLTL
ncbi:MAG: MMPL family transporter, partial [Pseudomonadota bacterium]